MDPYSPLAEVDDQWSGGLAEVAGLEVEALYGSFDKQPFNDDSREYVWVARKPG